MIGVVLAGLVCLGLSAFSAFRLPSFFGADERPHLSYTVSLLEGRLPELTDRQPFTDRYPIIERSSTPPGATVARRAHIFVAAHPPLAYVLAAPAVWLSGTGSSDDLPVVAFRLVNALAMAAGAAVAGLFAAELFPGRRGIAVSAALLTALVPNLVAVGGYAHNDGTAFLMTTACLLASARLLRHGLSRSRVAAASLLAGATMLTRASAAVAVTALVASAGVAAWRRGGGTWRAVARGVGVGFVIAATTAASAGWFYLRNRRLYGTATADSYLLEGLERRPRGSLFDALTEARFHRRMWSQLYGSVHPRLAVSRPAWVIAALAVVVAVGLALALARRLAQRERGPSSEAVDRHIGLAGWLIVVGFCAGVVATTAQFYADGGGPHPRYLLSVVPVVSALLARALAELPWARVALVVVAGALAAVIVSQFSRYPDLLDAAARPFTGSAAGTFAQVGAAAVAIGAGTAVLAWLSVDWWLARGPHPATASAAPGAASESVGAAGRRLVVGRRHGAQTGIDLASTEREHDAAPPGPPA